MPFWNVKFPPSDWIWNNSFTLSIGAVENLDKAPAHAPAANRSPVVGSLLKISFLCCTSSSFGGFLCTKRRNIFCLFVLSFSLSLSRVSQTLNIIIIIIFVVVSIVLIVLLLLSGTIITYIYKESRSTRPFVLMMRVNAWCSLLSGWTRFLFLFLLKLGMTTEREWWETKTTNVLFRVWKNELWFFLGDGRLLFVVLLFVRFVLKSCLTHTHLLSHLSERV